MLYITGFKSSQLLIYRSSLQNTGPLCPKPDAVPLMCNSSLNLLLFWYQCQSLSDRARKRCRFLCFQKQMPRMVCCVLCLPLPWLLEPGWAPSCPLCWLYRCSRWTGSDQEGASLVLDSLGGRRKCPFCGACSSFWSWTGLVVTCLAGWGLWESSWDPVMTWLSHVHCGQSRAHFALSCAHR